FHYVFLRSLRKLGLGLARQDEEDYLHAWNVLGHMLGIERALMADSMARARQDFDGFQARGRLRMRQPDPRPALAAALMQAMENEIPLRIFKPFPTLLTRHLCGRAARVDLGLDRRQPLLSRLLFTGGMA